MERVTFVIERTGSRISCLLNPEALEARRTAGVVRRHGAGGSLLGNPRTDDPLIATGGGVTEYDLQLLFDVDVANERSPALSAAVPMQSLPVAPADGDPAAPRTPTDGPVAEGAARPVALPEPPAVIDVRSLTQPLWALAETGDPVDNAFAPQRVRFIWGKSWNVPGVVLAVAERLERFDGNGVPQRSWLSLRLRRVAEEVESGTSPRQPTTPQFEIDSQPAGADADSGDTIAVPVDTQGYALYRYDLFGNDRFGDPARGRDLVAYNDLDDLLRFDEGQRLRVPPWSTLLA